MDIRPAVAVVDQRSFRNLLGQFGTGVVIIAAHDGTARVGMSANSFTSVSLEPPLVSFGASRSSLTWAHIRRVGGFAVSILGERHENLSRRFAARGIDRFAHGTWTRSTRGHPVVADGLGWLECTIEAVHPAGDHDLVIARATSWSDVSGGAPLIFHGGEYLRAAPALPHLEDVDQPGGYRSS